MVQPKTAPLSIRIPPALLERIDDIATGAGITRHAAILAMLGQGVETFGILGTPRMVKILPDESSAFVPIKTPGAPYGSRLKKR